MQRVGALIYGVNVGEPTCTPWQHHWYMHEACIVILNVCRVTT